MSSYYYLMAQLPGIVPNALPPITYAQFRETASRFLSARDMSLLGSLSITPPRVGSPTGSSLVDGWYRHERILRLALERFRAARLGREPVFTREEEERMSYFPDIQQTARAAAGIESPLEAERFLDQVRVSCLERLRGNHFFDSDAVFAYGLMLLLHERGDRFTAEAGRASYTTIYNRILGE